MRATWGCGATRAKAPPKALQQLADGFWRVVDPRAEGCPGCPFAGVYRPETEWSREVFDAMTLTATGDGGAGLPWADALARPITAADREAILAVQGARSRVLRAEMDQKKAERREAE